MAVSHVNFKQKTITGIGWSVFARLGRQGLQFVIEVILARLLLPQDFGLLGMLIVFIGFARIFTDLGLGSALIQKQDARPAHFFSIFWINVAVGFVLMLLFAGFSPLIARFYGEPVLVPLAIVISTNFLIGSISIVQSSLLRKRLDFRRLAFVELLATAGSGAAGILMALFGLGVWSLVVQSVLLTLFTGVLLWTVSDWRPMIRFEWGAVKEVLGFSTNLLGFTSVNYWLRNGDNLLVGKFLGTVALGLYAKSYSIMLLPLAMISNTIGYVMFPAFSAIQNDRKRIANVYLRITRTIALITFPMMAGLWTVSEHFVLVIFGPQWAGMIPVLNVFCLIGMLQSIGTLNGNLYLSQGRTDLQFKVGTVVGILGFGAIALGLRWGITGVARAYGLASVLLFYPSFSIAISLVDLAFSDLIRNLRAIAACTGVMVAAVWTLGLALPSLWPHWVLFVVQVSFGVITYLLLIRLFNVSAYREVRALLLEQWQLQRRQARGAATK
jgi:PST family polysaccharide transporter